MKQLKIFFVCLGILLSGQIQAQSVCTLCNGIDVYDTGTTMQDVLDFIELYATDTGEGQSNSYFKYVNQFWGNRVAKNDANADAGTKVNMFTQYHSLLREDMSFRQTGGCGTEGFQGSWELIGPKELPLQRMGKVDALWVSPADSNYILAGGMGGLFKTTDGGANWVCITDGVTLANGIVGISSIGVDPTDEDNIYLGTSGLEYDVINGNSLGLDGMIGGAAILKSSDGGQTWSQETVGGTGVAHEIQRVQRVYITPDGARLYAFAHERVYTRLVSSGNWQEITPPVGPVLSNNSIPMYVMYEWLDLEFVPGDQEHFFISCRFLDQNGAPRALIWETEEAVPGSGDWTEISRITASVSFTVSSVNFTGADIRNYLLSIPSADTLFVLALAYDKGGLPDEASTAVLKYNISGATHQWSHLGTLPSYSLADDYKLGFEVSSAANTNNNNNKVIYAATSDNFVSWDNGATYNPIGNYHPSLTANTHCDIRDIVLHKATNTARGTGDIVFYANDGGVAKKPANFDPQTMGISTTININGYGLACGTFPGFSTSEHGGIGMGGQMHNGKQAYEPAANPKWILVSPGDAYTTISDRADRTRMYGLAGFKFLGRSVTVPGGGRLINGETGSGRPPESNANMEAPLAADNDNHQYQGVSQLWEGIVTTPTNVTWDDPDAQGNNPGLELPTGNPNQRVRSIAISDYQYLRGYVLYNHTSNLLAQGFYYRDPAINSNFVAVSISNIPGGGTYPITDVTLDPRSPERVWISMGSLNWDETNNQAHNRVRYSPNAGSTWYAVDKGLPIHMPVTDIIYQEGANVVYCATDVGIFVADFSTFNASNSPNYGIEWKCFSKGIDGGPDFPYVYVTKLNINYCQGKLFASTYGRSIWATDLYKNNVQPTPTEVISSNTTWSSTKYIHAGIKITNGATLTIQNTGQDQTVIYMPKNGSIIVEPGAQLVVNGARITNGCEDCIWNGIRLVGQTNQPQSAANQGKLVLSGGAVIEHAKIGVANYGPDTPTFSNTGGIIEAVDATFLNNAHAVSLQPYKHQAGWSPVLKNYLASFAECDFIIDNDFKGGTTNRFLSHVDMREVDGIRFSGIGMYNRNTGGSYQGEGDGIRASNSGFRIKAACTSLSLPCTSLRRSRFTGLRTGVWMQYDNERMPYAAYIDRSNFDSCAVGIRSVGYHWFTASRDSFRLGYGKTTFLDPLDCHKNIGIWSEHSYFAHIEGNHFEGFTHGGQHQYHENIGTITDNSFSSAANNWSGNNLQIYRNTFLNLSRACYARGVNSDAGLYFSSNPAGLRYFCNTFDDNTYDIIVKAMSMHGNNVVQSIAYNQGSPNQSAGNQFLDRSSINHLLNVMDGAPGTFSYYHTTGNYVPILHINWPWNSIALYPTSNAHSCISTLSAESGGSGLDFPLSSSGLGTIKASFLVAKGNREVLQGTFDALIDGGNTDALLSYISGSTQADSPTVRTTLLGYSPYLTIPVLQAVADANILYQDVLMQILEANPEMLRDEALLDHLEYNIPNPLPGAQIDQLRMAAENSSARSDTQAEIADYATTMDWCSMMILNHYLLDTTSDDRDSIPVWLDNINSLRSNYLKAAFYTGMGDYTTAASILEDIPEYYELTGDQATEHGLYVDLWQLLKSIDDDDRLLRDMTPEELAELQAISDNPVATGRLIGTQVDVVRDVPIPQLYLACDADFTIGELKPGKNAGNSSNRENYRNQGIRSKNNIVKIYPNPAKDFVVFEYKLQQKSGNMSLYITNATGQKIKEIKLDGLSNKTEWETQSIPVGVYIYELKNGNACVDVGRIVITK